MTGEEKVIQVLAKNGVVRGGENGVQEFMEFQMKQVRRRYFILVEEYLKRVKIVGEVFIQLYWHDRVVGFGGYTRFCGLDFIQRAFNKRVGSEDDDGIEGFIEKLVGGVNSLFAENGITGMGRIFILYRDPSFFSPEHIKEIVVGGPVLKYRVPEGTFVHGIYQAICVVLFEKAC